MIERNRVTNNVMNCLLRGDAVTSWSHVLANSLRTKYVYHENASKVGCTFEDISVNGTR